MDLPFRADMAVLHWTNEKEYVILLFLTVEKG